MRNYLFGLCGVVLILAAPLGAEDMIERDMRVSDAAGTVTLKSADNSKQAVTVDEETPLREGDVIETGPKSRAEVIIDSETVITLEPGTRVKFKKIYVQNTQLEIAQGGIVAKVKPATSTNQNMIIKLPTAVVAIRGTEFAAETADSIAHVGVFDEGHIAVQGAWGHEHVKVGPNQETRVTLSNVPQPPTKMTYLRARRHDLYHVRNRVAFWKKNWKAMPVAQKNNIRQRLRNPNRPKGPGFRKAPPIKKAKVAPKKSLHPRRSRSRSRRVHASGQ